MINENYNILFRVSKITPTKIGQFVTIYKKPNPNEAIIPFDVSDNIDFIIISSIDGKHYGQFIFTKEVFLNNNILSSDGKGGKRAIRVYPSWTKLKMQSKHSNGS